LTSESPDDPVRPKKKLKNGPQVFAPCKFESNEQSIYYERKELCRSICGLPLWQITISKDSKSIKKKQTIIITSRVHAGETPASLVFKGIFNFLMSNKPEAKFLRRFYTFVLVPCLNPDGVVCGNYRSSISGVDLNRNWIKPDIDFQPEVFNVKKMMQVFTEIERR
jgi:murein tripeptide amidase MpaA